MSNSVPDDRVLSIIRSRIPDFYRRISPESLLQDYLRKNPPPEGYRYPNAILSLGKAAGGLTAGLSAHFQIPPERTLSVLPHGYPPPPSPFPCVFGSHPVPDSTSFETLIRTKRFLGSLPDKGILLVALSGGSSSILADPVPNVTIGEKALMTQRLIESGAPIEVINALRIHLSTIKGGGLSALIAPRKCLYYIFSDIPGSDPTLVGSAPLITVRRNGQEALGSLEFWLKENIPDSVSSALKSPVAFQPDIPLGYAPHFGGTIASSETLLSLSRKSFLTPEISGKIRIHILTDRLKGEARDAGSVISSLILWQSRTNPGWSAWIASGETTVRLPSGLHGQGGRSLELGLSLALELRKRKAIVLSLATDGWDGNSGLAGALIGAGSMASPQVFREAMDALASHDTGPFLRHHSMGIETGPSGSNLNDLVLILLPPQEGNEC
jgi:hydroxypyruvate reductase